MAFTLSDYNKFLKDPRSDRVTLAILKGYTPSSPARVLSKRNINNGININASLKINSTNIPLNFSVYNPYDVRDRVNNALVLGGITTVTCYLVRTQNGKFYHAAFKTTNTGVSATFSMNPPDSGNNALNSLILPIGTFNGKDGYTETFYLSSKQYTSAETDTPANQQFDPILIGMPRQTKSIEFFSAGGKSDIGELSIKNKEGRLDYWSELYFKGEDVTILLGDVSWPLSNFYISPRFVGAFRTNPEEQNPEINDDTIVFKFGNRFEKLNKPLQANKYTDTDPEPGKEIPLAYGLIKNARPAIINEATQERQINDGLVNSIQAIYDGGRDVTGLWTITNSNGKAVPGGVNKPTKTVTMDVQGIKDGATWLQYTGEIIKNLIKRNGDFTDDDIDLTSLSDIDTEKPYQIGLYINSSQPIINIIDELLDGIGAFRFVNYDNKLKFNLFKDPRNETPIAYFDDLNIIGAVTVFPIDQVRLKTQLDGEKNWTVQDRDSVQPYISDPTSGGYDPDLLTWLENEYRTTTSTSESPYPMSYTPPAQFCFIVNQADVLSEANLRQAFFNQPPKGMSFIADSTLFSLLPGDIINVVYSRHGMINSVNAQILEVKPEYDDRTIEIKAFYYYE